MMFFRRRLARCLILVLSCAVIVRFSPNLIDTTASKAHFGKRLQAALDPASHSSRPNESFPSPSSKATQLPNDGKYPRPDPLPCGWVPEHFIHATRSQCFLHCDSVSADNNTTLSNNDKGNHSTSDTSTSALTCRQVSVNTTVSSLSPKEIQCLKNFINQHCYGVGNTIPRVAHYVRFGVYNLTLDAFLSFYSVARFLQPYLILLHGDTIPSGTYWRALIHLLPNIVHVLLDRPREIFGRKINVVQHSSDVTRLRILLEYGGIYLDFDELLLNSFDDLLNKSTVLGAEIPRISINNALIVTKPNSEFLRVWLSRYTTFNDRRWAQHSTRLPYKLSKEYPHLVHVVETFFRPLPPFNRQFYLKKRIPNVNLTAHYAFHLYARDTYRFFYGSERIDKRDNAMGNVIRHILYGNQRACMKSAPKVSRKNKKKGKDGKR